MGGKGVMGLSSYGAALCQHIPQTAATQSCPAGCQACVSCVISSPVLHHIHCIFRSFPIHRSWRWPTLPILRLSRVSLIRRLSRGRIRPSGAHGTSGTHGVTWIGLLHVHWVTLWRITLRRVTLWRWALGWISWG